LLYIRVKRKQETRKLAVTTTVMITWRIKDFSSWQSVQFIYHC